MEDIPSIELLARFRQGDELAAAKIFDRYLERLTSLARARLSKKLARKVDAEDIVQSAYRSFFCGVQEGRFVLRESGKVWSLLAKITLRKVYRQFERHHTGKANIDLEQSVQQFDGIDVERIAQEPSPLEVAGITELLVNLMNDLKPLEREILSQFLQGSKVPDIAVSTNRSTKTVRRLLDRVEQELEAQLTCDSL